MRENAYIIIGMALAGIGKYILTKEKYISTTSKGFKPHAPFNHKKASQEIYTKRTYL